MIDELLSAGVAFIVVGGAAAVLHGCSVSTRDLDIVPALDEENLARLLSLLTRLDAWYREPGPRVLRPSAAHLRPGGQVRLTTRLGPLDILGRLHDGDGFAELLPHSIEVGEPLRFRIVDLPRLIAIKVGTGRPRDRFVAALLVDLLRQRDLEPER